MSNKQYSIDEELDVTLTVKVKLKSVSNYYPLTKDQINSEIDDAKINLGEFLKEELRKSYNQETLTLGVDYWNFEVV